MIQVKKSITLDEVKYYYFGLMLISDKIYLYTSGDDTKMLQTVTINGNKVGNFITAIKKFFNKVSDLTSMTEAGEIFDLIADHVCNQCIDGKGWMFNVRYNGRTLYIR